MRNAFSLLLVCLLVCTACGDNPAQPSTPSSVRDLLAAQRQKYALPALAAVRINGSEVEVASVGIRKSGRADSVTNDDRWHIGSNLKAMSATMIAMLVEEGRLEWNATLAELFPELTDVMQQVYRSVTLHMLLTHRGGILPLEDLEALQKLPHWSGSVTEQRRALAQWLLEQPPTSAPGTAAYSNGGYILAAAIAEKVTGVSWESLMMQRLFTPLEIQPVFGWPAAKGAAQPWGHVPGASGYEPFNPDGDMQIPAMIIPAGHCSMSLRDYARFALMHLDGLQGRSSLLSRETFRFLHTAVGEYAAGWSIVELGGTTTAWHEGSDGTFDAMIVMQPERRRASIVVTNCASEQAMVAINDACLLLLE